MARSSARSLRRLAMLPVGLLGLCFAPATAHAETQVPAGAVINQTWTKVGSPYVVAGDLIVPTGSYLIIEPGVEVRVIGNIPAPPALVVDGTIHAVGTKAEPISMSATEGLWAGLVLRSGASASTLGYLNLSSTYGLALDGLSSAETFHHLTLKDGMLGLLLTSAKVTLSDLDVSGADSGVDVQGTSEVTFINLQVHDNDQVGVQVRHNARVTLKNALLRKNLAGGLRFDTDGDSALELRNGTFYGNGPVGLSVSTAGETTVAISNSIFSNHSEYGVRVDPNDSAQLSIELTYSSFFGNAKGNTLALPLGAGCLTSNPQFKAAPSDLSLLASSPCIDAGNAAGAPTFDLRSAPRPSGAGYDMGAYELALTTSCGDGVVQAGESCDDGVRNGTYGYCKTDCTGLGDRCGDGVTNGAEQCDDGNSSNEDDCSNTCKMGHCGDGFVQPGEECDDNNLSNEDACTNACKLAVCGDGYKQPGEECDDGNLSNEDECKVDCKNPSCGDGIVWVGVEQCDDGNSSNEDGCTNLCKLATCGDSFVQPGEECDDGNGWDYDGCTNACTIAKCGDGFAQLDEECDDGNNVSGDGCSAECINENLGGEGGAGGSAGEAGSAGDGGDAGDGGEAGSAGDSGEAGESGNGGGAGSGEAGDGGGAGDGGSAGEASSAGEAGSAGDSGEAGESGNGGEAGAAGSGKAGSGTTNNPDDTDEPFPETQDDEGCGCRVVGDAQHERASSGLLLTAGLALGVLRRRRR